jgi:2-oxoisovalerate dehydrogenase E1 component beta subunit
MTHIPGWKIVMPSTPIDAYGLLLSACQEENPVMYLEPKALLRIKGEDLIPGEPGDDKLLSKMIDAPLGDRSKWKPNWPRLEPYSVAIGKARIARPGRTLTVVSYGRTLPLCVKAADELGADGIDAEVIDLRSLWPYDWQTISESVRRTGKVLYVNEDTEVTNFGEHLVRRTTEEHFYSLLAPPRLLAGKFVPGVGLADSLEMASVPQTPDIREAISKLAAEVP